MIDETDGPSASSWLFVFNVFFAMVVLTLVAALASGANVQSGSNSANDPAALPAVPLTISATTLLQDAIAGREVHVASTRNTLIVSFAGAPIWQTSPRACLADVVGFLDWRGQATWVGGRVGHVGAIVGDPASTHAYFTGLGAYCEPGEYSSADGGQTWTDGSRPSALATTPSWLAFDPFAPGRLLAYSGGSMASSNDWGESWVVSRTGVNPVAFDSTGRLVGWASAGLFESVDQGVTWQRTGIGPADEPDAAGATSGGTLIGAKSGLWWYPLDAARSLLHAGPVYSIATLGDEAVVLGSNVSGRPWLGTVSGTWPGIAMASLTPEIASLPIDGGDVAVNDSGAVVAFTGPRSLIAVAEFAH